MNKIFKVIFNRATGKLVVVSELTKSHGKAASSTDERSAVSSFAKFQHQAKAALMLGLLGASSMATATITEGTVSGSNGIAIGSGSSAAGAGSVVIGNSASSAITAADKSINSVVVIGNGSSVRNGSNAIAIGHQAFGEGNSAFAIGNQARVTVNDAVAMGTLSRASVVGAYASGIAARAAGAESVAIGWMTSTGTGGNAYNDNAATAHVATVAGKTGNFSVAIGSNLAVTGTKSIGIGYAGNGSAGNNANRDKADVSGDNSIALGHSNKVASDNSIALGNTINITSGVNNATALGNATSVTQVGGVALGAGSNASRAIPTTGGYDILTNAASDATDTTWKANAAAVSVGNATHTRQIVNVAAGSEDTDAVNVAQLKKVVASRADSTRTYTFSIENGASAQANTSGNADTWNLTTNDSLTFGASGDLNVTTDGAGKIVYGLSSTFSDKINNIETTANNANTTANNAKTVADAAKATADDAKATADTAKATADDAKATADTAKATADDAKATADTAKATADDAKATADTAKATADDAKATADDAKAIAGTGKDGKDGSTGTTGAAGQGLTGKDGLNGKDLTTKVNALRNGEAGSVVYTDAAGNRLVKANNGKYYPAAQVGEDGEPAAGATPEANPIASVVNPDGSTTAPTTMGNVKSNIGPNNGAGPITPNDAKTAVTDLLDDTTGLNNVATVGDLQAIAQAGLDFTGNNNGTTVHRALGSKLTVEGERDDNKTSYTEDESAKNNLIVEADNANNKLVVKMANELKNLKSIEASDSIKVGTDANGVSITPTGTTTKVTDAGGKVTTSTLGADGTSITGPDGKSAEYKLDGSKVAVTDPTTGETKETTMGADGTHAVEKDAQGNPTKSADYTADGSTVKAVDPTTGKAKESTYGADGLSTKALDKDGNVTSETTVTPEGVNLYGKDGKDGQDAKPVASLTNKVGTDGKNNPSLAFAKDGDNGTGSITGLKDVERNPDGTAKDKTQAANAGYVDDRLKEMNDGKPFEYFDKDGNQVVRGKDGNFYDPKDLEGKVYDTTTGKYYPAKADGTADTAQTPVEGKPASEVVIKAMPNTNEMALGNIKSNIGPNNGEQPITANAAKEAVAGTDGKSGLLTKTGPELNNAATVGDLQAIAQAGLDFTGNNAAENKDVHRPLGTKLTIEGETTNANQTKADFGATAANNIHVESKGADNKLVISLTEDLKGINSVDFKPAEITNPDGSTTYAKANISSKGNTYTETDKDGKPVENGKTASYGLNGTEMVETDAEGNKSVSTTTAKGTDIKETAKDGSEKTASYKVDGTELKETAADGTEKAASYKVDGTTLEEVAADGTEKSAEYKVDGSKVTVVDPTTGETKETKMDADGTHATVKDKDGNPTKSADYTADGSTVKAFDPTTGQPTAESKYGADGLSTKAFDENGNVKGETTVTPEGVNLYGKDGKDGKDAEPVASLTNKVDADGKNNPSLAFAKDGKGDDAKGTGSVTGLKDIERNLDGTAKDRTAAANAGYVDDRLAEVNAGKPFEYFEKDPVTGEVKTDANGDPVVLVRGKDGKFYKDGELDGTTFDEATGTYKNADGTPLAATPVDSNNVTVQAMPSPTGAPIEMGNVGSGLGLDDSKDGNKTPLTADDAKAVIGGADGKSGLLGKTGDSLNNVATVKDLQAIAQAGLDFTGNNSDTTVHRALGSKLTIEGEGAWNGQNSAANNLYVQADAENNKLVVKMNENLTGINSVDFKPTEITNPDGSKTYAKASMSSAGNTYVETDKDGKAVPNGKSATYGLNGSTLADGKGNVTDMTAAGTNVVDAAGNSATYGANGSKVADAAGNTANYGANGLTVADKDGNPAITLVNNASGPSLNFAKNADGTGTGKITGVAAGDITPDSTDVVTGAQVYALSGGNNVTINPETGITTSTAKDKDGNIIMATDENGNSVPKQYTLTTYNVEGQTEFVTNSVITAVHNMNEQGIKFFHTNDDKVTQVDQTGPNGIDSSASGAYATAVGYQATASGTNALAMGKGATVTGENSIAIGTGNQVLADKAGAFGDPNIIEKTATGSYAIGNDNVINSSNTFVLGNDVNNKLDADGKITSQAAGNTVENSVYLGNKSTATAGDGSATGTLKNLKQDGTQGSTTTAGSTGTVSTAKVGNMTYGGFAGAKADGVVSVGAAGNERRVQNVAAGEISATSTDAINGSQLYSVAKGVDQLDGKVNRMNRKLRSGIAAATAMTNIPQVTLPGKSALGAGVGSYDGQGALAVGYSRMSDNGRIILKLSAGASTQGKYNAGAGVAVQW